MSAITTLAPPGKAATLCGSHDSTRTTSPGSAVWGAARTRNAARPLSTSATW
jgi:hypothetical protein